MATRVVRRTQTVRIPSRRVTVTRTVRITTRVSR